MRIKVHYNLITKLWSVTALEGDRKGLVIRRPEQVALGGAIKFHVGEKSRQRAIREGVRNVHAYISGAEIPMIDMQGISISYNPYRMGSFYERDTFKPVSSASRVTFDADGTGYYKVLIQQED